MKYRSITLNGNKDYKFNLVKYTDKYQNHLEYFRKINSELADSVEQCPKIYSELSEHQSYMIMCDDYNCVGAIYIGTSTDEKNLEIKVHFDEKYFKSNNDIVAVVEQLVDSLGLFFYDKENIEIELVNNIDLSQFNGVKFKKRIYNEKLTTYIFSNEGNNSVIPAVINEISETERNLIEWNQSWMQEFYLCNYPDLDEEVDVDLINEYKNGTISLQEMFYKANALLWLGINSKKSMRRISFGRNGYIQFNKNSNDCDGIHYEFDYNVLGNWFNFKTYNIVDNKHLSIEENSCYTRIKSGNVANFSIFKNKDNHKKRINYVSPMKNNTSIAVELVLNEDEIIERCYVDFRTHKGNGKINGLYALRIIPGNVFSKFTLNYMSRGGRKGYDFAHLLPTDLFSAIIPGELTIELIDDIIDKSILVINQIAGIKHKQFVSLEENCIVSNVIGVEKQTIEFIKQIKGEIPLPHLQEILETFIQGNNRNKTKGKERVLKR